MILEKIQMIVDRPDSDGTRLRFHKNSGRVFISQSNEPDRWRPIGTIYIEDGNIVYYKNEKEADKYKKYMAWSVYYVLVEIADVIIYETELYKYRITSNRLRTESFIVKDKGHGRGKKYVCPIKHWDIMSKNPKYQKMMDRMGYEWLDVLKPVLRTKGVKELMGYLKKERSSSVVYPGSDELFLPLKLTGYTNTKVVIFDRHPLSREHAFGPAFHVPETSPVKHKYLERILDTIEEELYDGMNLNRSKNLESWMKQGVLLLNSTVTGNFYSPTAHKGIGWEDFNRCIVKLLSRDKVHQPVAFVLLGEEIQELYGDCVEDDRHLVIRAPYPDSEENLEKIRDIRIFERVNDFLKGNGQDAIVW